jgi:rhodanese-related sulfurtransferase
MSAATIGPAELYQVMKAGQPVDLIDVRTPAEYREVHAEGARSVPLGRLDCQAVLAARGARAAGPLYVVCRSGSRAAQACARFAAAGFPDAVSVAGGTLAGEQAGLPVARGRKAVSPERQVRLAAGALVFLGAALALAVDPRFALLPAFVGAGLVFAGVTDTCGMGMLLARMPWNQAGAPAGDGGRGERGMP